MFIERLWRSLKYECVYLHAFEAGSDARTGLARWIATTMPLGRIPPCWDAPDEAYTRQLGEMKVERMAA